MSGVTFTPYYTLRASSSGSDNSLKIRYQARISNLSGEDWNEVALSISTAQASETTTIPQLKRWTVDFINRSHVQEAVRAQSKAFGSNIGTVFASQPVQRQMLHMQATSAGAIGGMVRSQGSFGDDSFEEESEMMTTGAEVSEGITTTFIIQGKQTLKDGEKNHTVVIRDLVLPGKFANICVPKIKDVGYLQVPQPPPQLDSGLNVAGARQKHNGIPTASW
jgi:hypothetical protein